MTKDQIKFLKAIVQTPSPSGYEKSVRKLIKARMKTCCDKVQVDVMGNTIGILNPKADFRVMLAGHCDEIGLMVQNVTEEGYIYFNAIGGVDPALLPGMRVFIHSAKGDVPGVIGSKAIHMQRYEKGDKGTTQIHQLWIDIGAKSKKDVQKVVEIGDCATIDAGYLELKNNLIAARGLDDRCGAFVVTEVLRMLSKEKKLKIGVYGVATTQEEVGLRGATTGAYNVNPDVGITVEVCHASDFPTMNKNIVGDIKVGKGPSISRGPDTNPILCKLVQKTAKTSRIPHQMLASSRPGGTDTAVMQLTRGGVATVLISVPNRYMHSPVEVISLRDLENTAKLVAKTVLALKPNQNFVD